MRPPIFFIHPPKSGGSTVISFFDLNKGKDNFTRFVWEKHANWENTRKRLWESGIGGGHQTYGIHRGLRAPLTYCTILRDPLARQISHYRYAVSGKNGEIGAGASLSAVEALARSGDISMDEWVSESHGGRNLFVHMLSGHQNVDVGSLDAARLNLRRHIKVAGACEDMSGFLLRMCGKTDMKLPFYIETNRTEASPRNAAKLSDEARQKFVEDNQLDYQLLSDVKKDMEREEKMADGAYAKAIDLVRCIQGEINLLDNPRLYKSAIFSIDPQHMASVRSVIARFDLRPIEEYRQFVQTSRDETFDMYEGFVDGVTDGMVHGWAVNLNHPAKPVDLEIRVQGEVVATGASGGHRPDVRAGGYDTEYSGFAVPLPDSALEGFSVTIAGSHDLLNNAGAWRRGWYRG